MRRPTSMLEQKHPHQGQTLCTHISHQGNFMSKCKKYKMLTDYIEKSGTQYQYKKNAGTSQLRLIKAAHFGLKKIYEGTSRRWLALLNQAHHHSSFSRTEVLSKIFYSVSNLRGTSLYTSGLPNITSGLFLVAAPPENSEVHS